MERDAPALRDLARIHHIIAARSKRLWLGTRGGQRLIVFLPSGVIKIGLTRRERERLCREAAANALAARHPLWRDHVARVVLVARTGLWRARHERVGRADFGALARFVDERLTASADFPRRPMLEAVEARRLFGGLDADLRRAIGAALGDATLPASSMHGDLHVGNFVRDGAVLRVIDLETFDAAGSFAYDYVDFHCFVQKLNGRTTWPATLRRLTDRTAALRHAAQVAGVAPRALLLYYLLVKIETILARRGGMVRIATPDAAPYLDRLRRAAG